MVRAAYDAVGRGVAWSASGAGGPALLDVSGFLTHLLLDWRDPAIGGFQRELCAERRLLRCDRPGTGLSSGTPAQPHRDVDALDAVVTASGDDRVALFAHSFGAAAAIELTVRRPDVVSHLVLFGARAHAGDGGGALTPQLADALARLACADWNLAARTLADLLLPGTGAETLTSYAEHLRTAATGESAAIALHPQATLDLRESLPGIAVPTLVLHRRDDRVVSLHAARDLAARIPGARLQVLDGAEHLPHFGDTAEVHTAVTRFLTPAPTPLTRRETEVLHQVGEGLTNLEAGAALGVSEATVARHLANIYAKLDVATRGAAVARARRGGLL